MVSTASAHFFISGKNILDRNWLRRLFYNQRLVTIGYKKSSRSETHTVPRKKEHRSEETKRAIVAAAGQLFADRGYDAVTMREIAKAAGCSHTSIYIYFKDKEALLHQLSMEPLQSLQQQMEAALQKKEASPDDRLKSVTRTFIEFCLANRNMYTIFFMTKASRVDEQQPELEVQQLRNRLFGLLRQAVQHCLPAGCSDDLLLAYTRIYFFTLHGIIGTYTSSEEPLDQLLERLAPTFDLAVDVLLAGCKQTVKTGDDLE
jgi:AcrR family transcriptional regulator